MKQYTQKDALDEIFFSNEKPLSSNLLVYKHRYKLGALSQKSIDAILKEHDFIVSAPTIYTKK